MKSPEPENSPIKVKEIAVLATLWEKAKWEWNVFGDGRLMVVHTYFDVPLWRRWATGLLLGSKWVKLPGPGEQSNG